MTEKKYPRPEEVQKEFEDFVKQRFGNSVNLFTSQMHQNDESKDRKERKDSSSNFQLTFNYKPKDIKEYLDRFVVRQDEAKIALAIAVCDHYNHAKMSIQAEERNETHEYAKQNVLILGPTGVGKTYLIRKIADLIGVPFVKADATRFSETGYVGANVDDLIRDLVAQADGNIEKAQYGIVYLDEADKLASAPKQMGRDVNGRGVQFGLLRLMEETEVDLRSGNDIQSQIQALMDMQKGKSSGAKVNTRNILFIVSGAFSGLDEIIRKRLNQNPIGFNNTSTKLLKEDTDFFHYAVTQDFIEYGFEPEFIGRLPVRVACDHLNRDDLFQILKDSEGSIIRQYRQSFLSYDIEVNFTEESLLKIAEKAHQEKTGARSLMTICESIMRPFKYELPSTSIKTLSVTDRIVDNPKSELEKLLHTPNLIEKMSIREGLYRFEEEFQSQHDIKIKLSEDLKEQIVAHCQENQSSSFEFCRKLLHSYEHGLKLVQQHSGQNEFLLPLSVFFEPQEHLEGLIIESYGPKSTTVIAPSGHPN